MARHVNRGLASQPGCGGWLNFIPVWLCCLPDTGGFAPRPHEVKLVIFSKFLYQLTLILSGRHRDEYQGWFGQRQEDNGYRDPNRADTSNSRYKQPQNSVHHILPLQGKWINIFTSHLNFFDPATNEFISKTTNFKSTINQQIKTTNAMHINIHF